MLQNVQKFKGMTTFERHCRSLHCHLQSDTTRESMCVTPEQCPMKTGSGLTKGKVNRIWQTDTSWHTKYKTILCGSVRFCSKPIQLPNLRLCSRADNKAGKPCCSLTSHKFKTITASWTYSAHKACFFMSQCFQGSSSMLTFLHAYFALTKKKLLQPRKTNSLCC